MNNKELQEKILKQLNKGSTNIYKLSIKLKTSQDEIKKAIKELEKELLIKENNGTYSLTLDKDHRIGTLITTYKGLGVVKLSEEEVYFIDEEHLNNAIHGDKVLIKIIDNLTNSAIVETKKEELRKVVGTIYYKNSDFFVDLDNPLLKVKVKLDKNQGIFEEDQKVYIEFMSEKDRTTYKAKKVEILGNKNEIGMDITSIVKEIGINDKFSEKAMEEVKIIRPYVDKNEIVDRRDLRNEKMFTVDGKDSKDFDDAIGMTILDNNHSLVRVCITDVDEYVKEDSALDEEARLRGLTCYLLDRTIPMIPLELSDGICSLIPFLDRLTLTYEMEFDEEGNIVDYDIYLSVINSKARMTYEEVEDVITNEESEYHKDFQFELRKLDELCKKIHKNRVNNGYVDIERKEQKIDYSQEEGKIKNVTLHDRMNSAKIIEELMICANKIGTMYAKDNDIEIIRRVQDEETREMMEEKLVILEKLGFKKFEFPEGLSNNDIKREILNYYKNSKDISTIIRVLANSNRAYYTTEKINHSSLNEDDYTHLTSPIRRYPDLYSSRQIKKFLRKQNIEYKATVEVLNELNEKCNNIRLCSLRQEGLKLAEYHKDNNEVMKAKVINITERIIIIELEDLTTGVIPIKSMKGYRFNQNNYSCGKGQKENIKVGDYIHVEIEAIDKYFGRANYKVRKLSTND